MDSAAVGAAAAAASSTPTSATALSPAPPDTLPFASSWIAAASRRYQHYLDKAYPHVSRRWAWLGALAAAYFIRVLIIQGFFIVTYGLGIYLLNLLIAFLTPQDDPEIQELVDPSGPSLPVKASDEFRPFVRRLPEFRFCWAPERNHALLHFQRINAKNGKPAPPSKAGNNPAFSSGPHRAGLRSLSMAMVPGIQGQLLEVTVVSCNNLKDTEWISRQDPYVCLEYASTKFRSRTCTDGGKNPVFQQKTVIPLIEGLREISVSVWNSNTLTFDDFIGSGKVQLNKVLSGGYDDSSWPLQTKSGRFAGEVKLIMHYQNAQGIGLIGAQWNLNPVATVYGGAPYSSSPYPPVGAYPASYPPTSYPPIDPAKYPVSTYNAHQAMQQPYPTLPYPTTVYPPQPYPHSPYETPYLHSPYETPSYYPPQGPHHGYYPPC